MGVPAYGHTFTLASTSNIGIGVRTTGGGTAGPYTLESGILSYLEVCERLQSGYTRYWDDTQKVPYAVSGNQWISYDDVTSIQLKVAYAKSYNLGGIMIWSLESDDDKNLCGGGAYTINAAVYNAVFGSSTPSTAAPTTTTTTTTTTAKPATTTTTTTTTTTAKPVTTTTSTTTTTSGGTLICPASGYKRDPNDCSAFYQCIPGQGASLRMGNGRVSVSDLNPALCTHIIYQYITLTTYGSIQTMDIDTTELKNFVNLRNSSVKIMVSVGGPTQSSATKSSLMNNVSLRQAVVTAITNFVTQYGLDGVDIYWHLPVLAGGNPEDRANLLLLLQQLKTSLAGKLLTISAAPTKDYFMSSYDVASITNLVDFVNVKAFDLHASWDGMAGHNSPIYRATAETTKTTRELAASPILTGWISEGMAAGKIILGVSANGHSFQLASTSANKPRDRTLGPGAMGTYTAETGVLSYLEVCEKINQGGWTTVWDSVQMAQYSYKSDSWMSYESLAALQLKVDLATSNAIGGLGMWSMEGDDVRNVCGGGTFTLLSFLSTKLGVNNDNTDSTTTTTTTTTIKPTTTTTTSTTTTTTVAPSGSLPDYCPASGFVRDPDDCATYHRCVPLARFIKISTTTCANGLMFDTKALTCNWAYAVTC